MRNRYLDLLRAAAIIRVIVYHHFGWPILSIVFPAMGVMFAVAGSLTAASLAKRSAGSVVTSRMRRLLPPVWLLGLVAVPAMLYAGWQGETDGEHPFQPSTLVFWLLPLGDPPGSDAGAFVWDALWYVRTYLWLVLLSPVLFPLFRRVGWPLLALPLLLMVVLERGSFGMPAPVESALWDLATYGACWLAGFAHRDGRLGRTHPVLVLGAFAALAGLGLKWLVQGHEETGWDLNEVSEAQAVYSLAFVLLVLRWQPPIEKLVAVPAVDRLVNLLNARAVTVYLWHGAAIAAVWPILAAIAMEDLGSFEAPVTLGITFGVTALAVVAFGWAEDLAARRRPRLWPADPTAVRPAPPEPAGPAASPGAAGPAPAGSPVVHPSEPVTLGFQATPGLRLTPGGTDMPVAGRPVPGYGFDEATPQHRAGFDETAPRHRAGYGGVPWAGHSGDDGAP
ncbi:acyltransferase [Actinoplanes missouriensis]|uniref:acyltransferase family protein n=1 Tax=Actinoplanes missouriensis TaxID=1866 RepID=UPI0033ED7745